MSRSQNTPLLVALVVCIMAVAGAMVAAVIVSGQKSVVVVMPQTPPVAPAAAPVAAPTAAPSAATPSAVPAAKPVELSILRVAEVPALADVFDAAWNRIPVTDIPLQPQQTTTPMLEAGTIPAIKVQAVRDDKRIAWRLSWPAQRPAMAVETGQFCDAAAVQFPMADGAPFTMGAKDQPVRILHWKAIWQKDIDAGFQDVSVVYPASWTDMNWFSSTEGQAKTADLVKDPRARQFMSHFAAGNPMANTQRKTPLEEIVAEGFGTATTVPDSPSASRGVWKDGAWTLVIDRPITADDPLLARLTTATQNLVAFAVWDGSSSNRGGRKHYCTWVPMRLEK